MKCYICLTDSVVGRKDYMDLLQVTLSSARKNTTLKMICLYEGKVGDPVYRLLEEYGTEIILHEFPFKKEIMEIYPEEWMRKQLGKVIPYSRIFGAFMRLEIPVVEQEDDYVMYTDIDVYFNADIRKEDLPEPRYLAAAPEFEIKPEPGYMFNSGVLVLNVKGMREKYTIFKSMMEKRTPPCISMLDQGYLNDICRNDYEALDVKYNWKPYWGINDNACIIHFHGMKPGTKINEAGFATDNNFFINIFRDNPQGFAGYAWYFRKFYDVLGRPDDKWLYYHLQDILDLFKEREFQEVSKFRRKYRKYKSLLKLASCAGVLLATGLILALVL